ncbi:hypothetical protein POM88_050311 [Heracleum sosnowskyi]|uniref:DNA (cytosine-5-)-methyltransferase n=1 Tax=Heracleum sosnowskyi TaxID=360622 RepID=A0AAD8GZW7_9APIA|nr:hypothetical protein POM88_050311 [Heracleum sosnowskyi]
MNIVEYLKPKYVLMENVVDIVRFDKGFLGRYALGRLVVMNYQTRLGMMVAGAYGLPQFRMRVFLWGARHNMILPHFPLPTHNVVVRGHSPLEFESNVVTYDDGCFPVLKDKLYLGDAISDLPAVFTDLRGVKVRSDNKVEWEPDIDRVYLPSGKPLVPDYAMTFVQGTSSKPFERLWWDETVFIVVTRAEPHNQARFSILMFVPNKIVLMINLKVFLIIINSLVLSRKGTFK